MISRKLWPRHADRGLGWLLAALICIGAVLAGRDPAGAAPGGPLATVEHYGGSHSSWPTTWYPFATLNDGRDSALSGKEQVDLVGDTTNPAVYWNSTSDYLYFRIRVDYAGTVTTSTPFKDSHFVFIDIAGTGTTGYPDYAFAWDTQSNDITKHGLEMMKPVSNPGATWGAYQMDDLDGDPNKKVFTSGSADFGLDNNDGIDNSDGYVRTVDAQSTTNFGNTTFIDIAAKWSYLEANTALRRAGQTWKIQVGTRFSSTDHNTISTDVGGGCAPSSQVTACWSGNVTPSNPLAVTLAAFTAAVTPAGVTLAWETVSENDNAGFNVYRADGGSVGPTGVLRKDRPQQVGDRLQQEGDRLQQEGARSAPQGCCAKTGPNGEWVRLNAALIPAAAPGSSEGHAYTWTDATARPGTGRSYVYRLEAVALDGSAETLETLDVTYRPAQRRWLPLAR